MAVISGWRYEGPYAICDLKPLDEQRRLGRGFANPRNRYYSFADGARLVGFINLIGNEAAVFLGVGVRPDLCGQGYGTQICRQALALARQLHPGKPVALEVRSWNRRAIRCYEKCGFRHEGRLREHVFRDGHYEDVLEMGVLRREFEAMKGADDA